MVENKTLEINAIHAHTLTSFDKSNKCKFHHSSFSKNNVNSTIDLLSLGIYVPGPQALTLWHQITRGVESALRFGFRVRNGELKGSGVSGLEGDNSQFRGARPKLISYSDSPYPKPRFAHCLLPAGNFGPIYRTEPVSGQNSNPCPGQNTVWLGKAAQKHPWVPRNVWSGVSGTGNLNMKLVLV